MWLVEMYQDSSPCPQDWERCHLNQLGGLLGRKIGLHRLSGGSGLCWGNGGWGRSNPSILGANRPWSQTASGQIWFRCSLASSVMWANRLISVPQLSLALNKWRVVKTKWIKTCKPQRIGNRCSNKNLYSSVYSSTIHSSQEMETIQISNSRRMDKPMCDIRAVGYYPAIKGIKCWFILQCGWRLNTVSATSQTQRTTYCVKCPE